MAARPLIFNPSYLAMVRGVRELHRLSAAGKDDSPEADAVRDATDQPWETLSELERQRVRNLSEDLYSLSEPAPAAIAMSPEAQAGLYEAVEARRRGEWDRALDLIRHWQAYFDPALVSFHRGAIWLDAGDPETAILFLDHAAKSRPANGSFLGLFLHTLDTVDPATARQRADEILGNPDTFPPRGVFYAADIVLTSGLRKWAANIEHLFRRMVSILQALLTRVKKGDEGGLDVLCYAMTIELLGRCHEFLGETQIALNCYTEGLRADPKNETLLMARGMLLYGTSSLAIADLELAIQYGSPSIWPYFFLAHHFLTSGSFQKCAKFCEQALELSGSSAVKSELTEWLGIAQTELGFPPEIPRGSFEKAIRLDAGNSRAGENLENFENAIQATARKAWETPSASAVRKLGLTERRFGLAA